MIFSSRSTGIYTFPTSAIHDASVFRFRWSWYVLFVKDRSFALTKFMNEFIQVLKEKNARMWKKTKGKGKGERIHQIQRNYSIYLSIE